MEIGITGMHCAACAGRAAAALSRVPGVESAHVNLVLGSARICAQPDVPMASVAAALESAGYGLAVPPSGRTRDEGGGEHKG